MHSEASKQHRRAKKKQICEQRHVYVAEYKLGRGCADCGYTKCAAALEFDHRPGEQKLWNIGNWASSSFHGISVEALHREIAKCDVVCANCHRERHVLRSQDVAGEGEVSASKLTPVSAPSDFQALLQAARGEYGPGVSYPLCLADDVWRGVIPPTGPWENHHVSL